MAIRRTACLALLVYPLFGVAQGTDFPLTVNGLFDPKFFSSAANFTLSVPGDGFGPGRLTHRRCGAAADDAEGAQPQTCEILVRYDGFPRPNNNCGIRVDDVTMLRRAHTRIVWKLDPEPALIDSADAETRRFRFVNMFKLAGEDIHAVHFRDLKTDPDSDPVFHEKVLLSGPTRSSPIEFSWTRERAVGGQPKVFYYALILERWDPIAQNFVRCDPYDPIIVNRGG